MMSFGVDILGGQYSVGVDFLFRELVVSNFPFFNSNKRKEYIWRNLKHYSIHRFLVIVCYYYFFNDKILNSLIVPPNNYSLNAQIYEFRFDALNLILLLIASTAKAEPPKLKN